MHDEEMYDNNVKMPGWLCQRGRRGCLQHAMHHSMTCA